MQWIILLSLVGYNVFQRSEAASFLDLFRPPNSQDKNEEKSLVLLHVVLYKT